MNKVKLEIERATTAIVSKVMVGGAQIGTVQDLNSRNEYGIVPSGQYRFHAVLKLPVRSQLVGLSNITQGFGPTELEACDDAVTTSRDEIAEFNRALEELADMMGVDP